MAGEIQIMIPQYGELNRIYNDFLISHTFSFDRQKFITDFYKQYNNTKAFEAAILELVLDKPKEQYTLVLNSLRTEIEKNILIYEKHPLFDNEVISRVCYNFAGRYDADIKAQLEVLQHNKRALKIYESLGFEILREFNFFTQKKQLVVNHLSDKPAKCSIVALKSEDILSAQSFHDFTPSWQNDIESIKRAGDDLVTLGAMVDSVLSGYCVFSPKSGDITQIAVDPTFRRKGVASSLLKQMIEMTESEIVKVINVESPTPSLDAFLASKGVCLAGKQFEMVLTL